MFNIYAIYLYTESKSSGNEDKLKNIERNQSNILPGEFCCIFPLFLKQIVFYRCSFSALKSEHKLQTKPKLTSIREGCSCG